MLDVFLLRAFILECRSTGSRLHLPGFTEAAQSGELHPPPALFPLLLKAKGQRAELLLRVFHGKLIRHLLTDQSERRKRRSRRGEEDLQRRRRDRGVEEKRRRTWRGQEKEEKKNRGSRMVQI